MATAPDYKNIPHSHRLPVTHRDVQRTFTRLSRQSLISLAQQWLSKKNRDFCKPFLLSDRNEVEDEDDDDLNEELYEPAQSYEELLETYNELAARKGGRREVLDRILEGDWRSGVSMYMLATAEIQYLLDHPNSLRWTARRLTRIPNARSAITDMEVTNDSDHLPRFQAQTFMSNLARELTPLMKAHYLITRIKTSPMTILRVYIHDSPYSNESALALESNSSDTAKAVFFVWPNGSPFVYSSLATHTGQVVGDDGRHLRDIVQQAIPKAFSRPSARYQLASTNFTTKSLDALLTYRGPGKSNGATGGWSIFQDHSFSQNALDFITAQKNDEQGNDSKGKNTANTLAKVGPGRPKRALDSTETPESKRRKEVAQGRFGTSAQPDDGHGLERFEVRIDDAFPSTQSKGVEADGDTSRTSAQPSNRGRRGRHSVLDRTEEETEQLQSEDGWVPNVRIAFTGTHVFAGIRQLVEEGIVDGEKMPGWMTGEAGVTIGAPLSRANLATFPLAASRLLHADDDIINIHEHLLDSKLPIWRTYYAELETSTDAKGEIHYIDRYTWDVSYEALSFWLYQDPGSFNGNVAFKLGLCLEWFEGEEEQPVAMSSAMQLYIFVDQRGWHKLMDELMT